MDPACKGGSNFRLAALNLAPGVLLARAGLLTLALLAGCDPCRDLAAAAFEQANIDCVAGDQSACAWLATHTYGDAIDNCPVVTP